MKIIQIWIAQALLAVGTWAYAFQVSIQTGAGASVTDFRQDLGSCECDLTTACDNFCCCDSACDSGKVTEWEDSDWCRESPAQIQKMCTEVATKGYSSFEDLGCVVYTNRASIGNFYDLPDTSNIVFPSVPKFANRNSNTQSITQGASPPSTYSEGSIIQIKLDSNQQNLEIWRPSGGEGCAKGFATILNESQSYQCTYSVQSSDQCTALNSILSGALTICQTADCANEITNADTLSSSTYSSGTCSGAVTGIQITYILQYQNSQYKISSGSVVFTTESVTGKASVLTTISVSVSNSERSGNPGYIIGKPLQFASGSIQGIATTTGDCDTTGGSVLDLQFGVNQTFTCQAGSDPCASSYYVDSLSVADFQFSKYATGSEAVRVSGISSNTCTKQVITLSILYSTSGWVLDPQYYILGGLVTTLSGAEPSWTRKFFKIEWIQVSPDQISTPPTNYFYEYFNLLWSPLRDRFQTYLWGRILILPLAFLMIFAVL